MSEDKGYKSLPLTINRRAVIASATITKKKNTIHSFVEVDITEPRQKMKSYFEKTEKKLSLTAYIVSCLAQTLKDYPQFNSFIKRRKLIILNDITISVLVERNIKGEKVSEPIGIKKTQIKSPIQIQDEIMAAKNR